MTSYADEQIADAERRRERAERTELGAPQIGSYQPKVVSVEAEAEAAKIQVAERRKAYAETKIEGLVKVSTASLPDSGKRAEFESGMVRDVEDDKVKYDLVLDGPMFERWAVHMTAGAEKYDERNWMLAEGDAEFQRFRRSALRHFIQWFQGNDTEDHAAAVFFNINGAEYVTDRMVEQVEPIVDPRHYDEWVAPVRAEPAKFGIDLDRRSDGGF